LTLENINFPPDFFDVVSMFDVFEHLPEPRETLSEIQRIMKPGGILAINFPAIDSYFAKIMGSHWCLLLEDHLNYFSKKTLTKMLDKYGFKVLFFKRHWQDLTLKYLVEISCSFSPKLSKTLAAIVKFLHLGKISLRYYIGQATVLAKKV
jgi:ubiquinone/menaquinone biosynthesis C-methylase UbiE